jgi:hypothetical protein
MEARLGYVNLLNGRLDRSSSSATNGTGSSSTGRSAVRILPSAAPRHKYTAVVRSALRTLLICDPDARCMGSKYDMLVRPGAAATPPLEGRLPSRKRGAKTSCDRPKDEFTARCMHARAFCIQ